MKTMFGMCPVYPEMRIGRAEASRKALEAQMQVSEIRSEYSPIAS